MKRLSKSPSGNLRIIYRYRTAQEMLLKGCTVKDLCVALSISDKSVRRMIADLHVDGCTIKTTFVRGTQDAAVLRLVGKKRIV